MCSLRRFYANIQYKIRHFYGFYTGEPTLWQFNPESSGWLDPTHDTNADRVKRSHASDFNL